MTDTPARLLAFDTSTEVLSVAACGPRGVCAVNLPGGAAASAHLVPQIERMLSEAGLAFADLQALAFGRGPGAFTGLRTSCAVAQGLGLGLGRPLLPLDSLLVVAEDTFGGAALPPAPALLAVAMDARMDEIYGALYERASAAQPGAAPTWRTVRAPALFTLPAWNALIDETGSSLHGMAGSALSAFGARLRRPAQARTVAGENDRAAALLRLARQAWAAGAAVDAAAALPLYLRDKVALTTAERAAAPRAPRPGSPGSSPQGGTQPSRAAHG